MTLIQRWWFKVADFVPKAEPIKNYSTVYDPTAELIKTSQKLLYVFF
ncbi:unnamed protein product [Brassica oleracea var. botrytis]|uniref:(rape) hypothetical protein n=1 Tax=Brassica napus TaxID=3708 RepID=A0A816RZL5_BRANA|nr:unnamed protein product [Brassica napus]